MENNQLSLSTDDAGTLQIEWNRCDSAYILTSMRIMLEDGEILYGKLLPSGQHRVAEVWHREGDPRLVPLSDIVALNPMREHLLNRLDGYVSEGFSYVKANDLMQINFDGLLKYTSEKNYFELSYNAIATREQETETTQRQNGNITYRRVMPGKWFTISQFSLETNSQLGLDLRSNLAGGVGRSIIRTNSSHLFWSAGLQINREISVSLKQYNLESIAILKYSLFIYHSPEVSFNLRADVIPSLSDAGRFRNNIDSSLKWEIFKDFFIKWSVYYSFDSRPLSATAAKSDWAVTLLGLEYKL